MKIVMLIAVFSEISYSSEGLLAIKSLIKKEIYEFEVKSWD